MKTAVVYARFSCNKQSEASIEDQLRVCKTWCQENGYEIVAEYCDHSISGRTDDRPEFLRMIANAGESDIVLVKTMDRFSRDMDDALTYMKALSTAGVHLVSATERVPDASEAVLLEKLYKAFPCIDESD